MSTTEKRWLATYVNADVFIAEITMSLRRKTMSVKDPDTKVRGLVSNKSYPLSFLMQCSRLKLDDSRFRRTREEAIAQLSLDLQSRVTLYMGVLQDSYRALGLLIREHLR